MRNALSVDVEDWFQVGAFEGTILRDSWESLPHRVEQNTIAVLDLLEQAGVSATFFILGWVAERYPSLVRRIAEAGHEVASHGYDHRRVFSMSPTEFQSDLRISRNLIEDSGGKRVIGYRAPSFSIDARTPWAHEILAQEGYTYSSSVAPVRHDHYGWPDAPRFAYHPLTDSALVELPITTARLGGRTVAAGGGGFFRLLPYSFSRWAIRQVNKQDQQPAIIYFHPWEIDAGQPRITGAPLRSQLRHYSRIKEMAPKLMKLLGDFDWGRIDALIGEECARGLEAPHSTKGLAA